MSGFKCLLLVGGAVLACAAIAQPDPVAGLRAKYASLDQQLRQNQFQRPLVVDSSEISNRLKGDIYAIIDYPFGAVSVGLNSPDHWCDVMILHINTKYCRAVAGPSGTSDYRLQQEALALPGGTQHHALLPCNRQLSGRHPCGTARPA